MVKPDEVLYDLGEVDQVLADEIHDLADSGDEVLVGEDPHEVDKMIMHSIVFYILMCLL